MSGGPFDCPLFGRWRGCKFEARYHEKVPYDAFWEAPSSLALITHTTNKTYVHDVCVRCGRTTERKEEKPNA